MWSLIVPNASGKKKQKETQPQYLTRLKSVHNLPIKFHFIRQFLPSNGWPSPAIMVSVGALDFIRINRISSNSKTETLDWVCTVWKVWKKVWEVEFSVSRLETVWKTRGPGFDPQLRCLKFSASPSWCQCFLYFNRCVGNGLLDVFTPSGSASLCHKFMFGRHFRS